jgi:hypothetical protein
MSKRKVLSLVALALPPIVLYAVFSHLNWGLWPSQHDRIVQRALADVDRVILMTGYLSVSPCHIHERCGAPKPALLSRRCDFTTIAKRLT